MSLKSNPSDWVMDISVMEKNVYTLKLLRDKLHACSEQSRDAAIYGRELEPPQMPERPKCKIKSVPEMPEPDKNSRMLKYSKYLIGAGIAFAVVGLILAIVLAVKYDLSTTPFAESGALGKAMIIVFAMALISIVAAAVLSVLDKSAYKEVLGSWEAVKQQIDEQNQQEIIRCQEEDSKAQAEYASRISEYEQIKLVYTLREGVNSQLFDLARSKVHNLVALADKQLAYVYNVTNLVPAELRRFDAMIKINDYIETEESSGGEAAIRSFLRGVKEGRLPAYLSDFTENMNAYAEEMAPVCEFAAQAETTASRAIHSMEVFNDTIVNKSVNFEAQTVNNSILAVEFAKTYEDSSVAVLAAEIAEETQNIAEQYLV